MGLGVGAVLIGSLPFWKEAVIAYHLRRLRQEEGYLPRMVVEPEGSPGRAAVLRYLASEAGRTALADLYLPETYGVAMRAYQGRWEEMTDFLEMSLAMDVRNQRWQVRGPLVNGSGTGSYRSEADWLDAPAPSKHGVSWSTILAVEGLLPVLRGQVIRLPRYPGIAFELVE